MRPIPFILSATVIVGASLTSPAVTAASTLSTPAPSAGQSTFPATLQVAERYVRQQRKATGATSITVGLVEGDRSVWAFSDGKGDVSGAKPTDDQAYAIGSVSKMFATVAIMQLVDQGKVVLDNPVVNYVPDFTMQDPAYRQITVRMLLDHSAGFPGSSYADGMTTSPQTAYADHVLRELANQRLKTTPGSMSVYCNDCFTMAGIVVQRVSGMSYTDYVTTHILEPLEMTHSYFATTPVNPSIYAPAIS